MNQTYSKEFFCLYQIQLYPFDTQVNFLHLYKLLWLVSLKVCYIQMSMSEFDKQTVELLPGEMIIPSRIKLPQYQIEESRVKLEFRNEGRVNVKDYIQSLQWYEFRGHIRRDTDENCLQKSDYE